MQAMGTCCSKSGSLSHSRNPPQRRASTSRQQIRLSAHPPTVHNSPGPSQRDRRNQVPDTLEKLFPVQEAADRDAMQVILSHPALLHSCIVDRRQIAQKQSETGEGKRAVPKAARDTNEKVGGAEANFHGLGWSQSISATTITNHPRSP